MWGGFQKRLFEVKKKKEREGKTHVTSGASF